MCFRNVYTLATFYKKVFCAYIKGTSQTQKEVATMLVTRVLYTGQGEESQEARRLLQEAGLEFTECFVPDPETEQEDVEELPHLVAPEEDCRGIEPIRRYVEVYGNQPLARA